MVANGPRAAAAPTCDSAKPAPTYGWKRRCSPREAHERDVQFAQIFQIDDAEAAVERRGAIAQRKGLLIEERLSAGDVQAAMRTRDQPVDSGERRLAIGRPLSAKANPPPFTPPEPRVLELTAMLR